MSSDVIVVVDGLALTPTFTFKAAVDNEQPAECERICYLIRSVATTFFLIDRQSSADLLSVACPGHIYLTVLRCGMAFVMSRFWIQEFWMMFRLQSSLSGSLEQFQEVVRDLGQEHLSPLLDTKWM